MEIILIRHGKSERFDVPKLNISQYKDWKKEYDELGVVTSKNKYYNEAYSHIERADVVFTSMLNRTQHSLALLRPDMIGTPKEIFNEVDFRPPELGGIRLNSGLWTVITGSCWYFGLIRDHETKKQVRMRAEIASDILTRTAEKGTVALIGHGFINLFIYKELTYRGWREVNKYRSKNWSCPRLVYN